MIYRREIDGLRAVAVVAVMLFHSGFQQFSGGYVGVDVFLVISGYLITGILLEDIRQGRFSLRTFYDRRARRILPALFLVLAASSLAALALLTPREMVDYAKSLAAVSALGANFFFWRGGGYFDGAAEHKPLLHTWSLAVEEQYYVLFPLLLLFLLRRCRSERQAVTILVAVGLASFALAAWGAWRDSRAAFFLLHTRAWELLLGGCLAALERPAGAPAPAARPWRDQLLALLGLGMIAYAVVFFDAETPFPGVHALLPTVGTALLILHARSGTLVGRLLASPLFVGIGLVSYSAYLWHQPLLAFARVHTGMELAPLQGAALCAGALALGYLSWRYVEQPFRRRGVWPEAAVLQCAAAGLLAFLVLGAAGVASRGFESLYLARLGDADRKTYALIQQTTAGSLLDAMVDDGGCRFWAPQLTEPVVQRYRKCTANGAKALVVLGDSHAMNIYNALARTHAAPVVVGFVQAGCHPYGPPKACQYEAFEQFAAAHRDSMERVVYHQSGGYLILDRQGARDKDNAFLKTGEFAVDRESIAQVHAYLDRLGRSGLDVTWLGPFPEPRRDLRNPRALQDGAGFAAPVRVAFQALESAIAPVVQGASSYRYLPMLGRYISAEEPLLQGSCLLFRDKDHLSTCGERLIGERLKNGLRAAALPLQPAAAGAGAGAGAGS